MNFVSVFISAGGFGERLSLASSSVFPKQFLFLENGLSFLLNLGTIWILTRLEIYDTVVQQCIQYSKTLPIKIRNAFLDKIRIFAEPLPKHTAITKRRIK